MKSILIIALTFTLISCSDTKTSKKSDPKTILAVLAHPDDETALAQILYRYAREGNKVYLVIATDGRYGVAEHAGIPPGDSLAAVRRAETICACEILGIEEPIFFDAHDAFGAINGMDEYFRQTGMVKEKLTKTISELNPDIIITFGPDGDTGHFDHRGISNIVTEVLLKNKGWYEKYPLFYLGWTEKDDEKFKMIGGLNTVHPDYLNVVIHFSQEEENEALKILDCYKSQFTEGEIVGWKEIEKSDTTNTLYFRQFVTDTIVRNHF